MGASLTEMFEELTGHVHGGSHGKGLFIIIIRKGGEFYFRFQVVLFVCTLHYVMHFINAKINIYLSLKIYNFKLQFQSISNFWEFLSL